MEQRIYIRQQASESAFRVMKIVQSSNGDITIIPHHSVYIDRSFLDDTAVGDKLLVSAQENELLIDHFSGHSATGQRHVKFDPRDKAFDPIMGEQFMQIQRPVPLVTVIATTARTPDKAPSKKWFGIEISANTDYCIFDLVAIPKGTSLQVGMHHSITNDRMSVETFIQPIAIPLRTVDVILLGRTSTHDSCNLPYNVLVQQSEGKTGQVVRAANQVIRIEVVDLQTELPKDATP